MITLADLIAKSRVDLNDSDKIRWSDAELISHANAAIREAYQIRPDLRLGAYATDVFDLAIGDTFPLDGWYVRAVADFVVARASAKDAEYAEGGRAPVYMTAFRNTLLGV